MGLAAVSETEPGIRYGKRGKSTKKRKTASSPPQPKLPPGQIIDTVDNPGWQYGHPESIRKVVVVRSLRTDPLRRLLAHGQIDTEQYEAGREWQETYEATTIGQVHGIDTTREYVDSSPCRGIPISDRTQRAVKQLDEWDRALGKLDSVIVRMVLVHGLSMEDIGKRMGDETKRAIEYYGRRFRECLTRLAIEMGYRTEA